MNVTTLSIPDVWLLEPKVFADARGYFFESYNRKTFHEIGLDAAFVQDNQSRSSRHVLRGLHYQIRHPQGRLVRVLAGTILDVAVDLRRSSTTFGKWVAEELSGENKRMLWIPSGFAHGFSVLSDFAEVSYKADEYYAPEYERTIVWNDAELAIDWKIPEPVLSAKDAAGKRFCDAEVFM